MNKVDWSTYLIEEIVEKRCILFLGAGISMDAKPIGAGNTGLKSWKGFIEAARDTLVKDATKQQMVTDFLSKGNFLLGLQAIKKFADPGEYLTFLNTELNKNLAQGELHEIIYDLDCKILVTTNFDKVFEKVLHGYHKNDSGFHVVDYNSTSIVDHIRSRDILLIKAHGSIAHPDQMIFTKEEYLRAKKEHPSFYKILQSLFLTNTVLFLGCSLTDPDILLILEELRELGKYSKPHYCTILESESNEVIEEDWLRSYNVKTLKYGPTHDVLKESLKELRTRKNSLKASSITA
jgi:hypothetical protein